MSPILWTIATAVAAAGSGWLLVTWARAHTRDLQSAAVFLEEYYEAAQKLTKDPATPDSLLGFVEHMAARAGDPRLARSVAWHMVRGKLGAKGAGDVRARQDFKRDVDALPPHLREAFATMVTSGTIASAAADPLLSRVYLNLLSLMFSSSGENDDTPSVERASVVVLLFGFPLNVPLGELPGKLMRL
jgi:hypothetical protein